jgi:hypothetical protein
MSAPPLRELRYVVLLVSFGALGCSSSSSPSTTTEASTSCHVASNARVVSVSLVGPTALSGADAGLPNSLCPEVPVADCTAVVDIASCSATVSCTSASGEVLISTVIQAADGGSSLTGSCSVTGGADITEAGVEYQCNYDVGAM